MVWRVGWLGKGGSSVNARHWVRPDGGIWLSCKHTLPGDGIQTFTGPSLAMLLKFDQNIGLN